MSGIPGELEATKKELKDVEEAHQRLTDKVKKAKETQGAAVHPVAKIWLLTKTGDCAHLNRSCPTLHRSVGLEEVSVCSPCQRLGLEV